MDKPILTDTAQPVDDQASFSLLNYQALSEPEMHFKSIEYYHLMNTRRTVRTFSSKKVPQLVLENCLKTAGTAPSGANKQPYEFFVIQTQSIKDEIRVAAEEEEYAFYNGRAPQSWLDDLKKFKTNSVKEHLSKAPALIAIFSKPFELVNGEKQNNYYSIESTGLATGFLISALHNANLASLTHTPSPMNFLNKIVGAPAHYRAFLLLAVGYPEKETLVPNQTRKELKAIAQFL